MQVLPPPPDGFPLTSVLYLIEAVLPANIMEMSKTVRLLGGKMFHCEIEIRSGQGESLLILASNRTLNGHFHHPK